MLNLVIHFFSPSLSLSLSYSLPHFVFSPPGSSCTLLCLLVLVSLSRLEKKRRKRRKRREKGRLSRHHPDPERESSFFSSFPVQEFKLSSSSSPSTDVVPSFFHLSFPHLSLSLYSILSSLLSTDFIHVEKKIPSSGVSGSFSSLHIYFFPFFLSFSLSSSFL